MNLGLQNLAIYSLQIAILVAVGGVLPFACRLDSVRARLLWWQTLLAACLVLPAIEPWKQVVLDSAVAISGGAIGIVRSARPAAAAPFPWAGALAVTLAAGTLLRLAWLALGCYRLRTYLERATLYQCSLARQMEVHAYVGLSDDVSSPVTFGFRRPVILFPTRFSEMEPAMQETVACHELLHVERRDWVFSVAEEIVRALFWFHPAIWWLLGEIQLTREQVVDREVVRLTQSREHYLNALLAIATTRARLDLAPAPLFLRKRHLSQRVSQIVKEVRMSRTRIAASFAGISSVLLVAGILVVRSLPLEAAPQAPPDSPGVTVDQAEANLLHRAPVEYPREAKAKGIQGNIVLDVDIDETGAVSDARVVSGPQELRRAALQSVLQWHYSRNMPLPGKTQVTVKFELPPAAAAPAAKPQLQAFIRTPPTPGSREAAGTPTMLKVIDLSPLPSELQAELREKIGKYEGVAVNRDLMQEVTQAVAGVDKHVIVGWSRARDAQGNAAYSLRLSLETVPAFRTGGGVTTPTGGPAESGATPQRIRVGGNVQQLMLVEKVRPVYPPEAKQARIQGVVRFTAIIGKDGHVQSLTVDSGHPLLVDSAMEAVKQWVYKPTLLNGEPVEVQTAIDVNYTLSQ